ncbi:MAG: glycosyltransferase [Candidatus Eisenbacteria bacterium]
MPAVSVIIPTYNRASLVRESIESVFAQTFKDYEIVVVDDGSTDNTGVLLDPLVEAGRIRYVRTPNRGESAARNVGLEMACGKYIAFNDSDDLFTPRKLEKQVAFLESSPGIALVHSGYGKFDEEGRELGYRDTSRFAGRCYPRILLEWTVLMAVPTVLVRASVMGEVGGFDERMKRAADLDMWRRITMRHPIGVLPEMLSRVRVHRGNVSEDKALAEDAFRIYLQKAFDEDRSLGRAFRRRAAARMYMNVARTLLGEGTSRQMRLVRGCAVRSGMSWPFYPGSYAAYLVSFLAPEIRKRLAVLYRRGRFRPFTPKVKGGSLLFLGSKLAVGGAQKILFTHAEWFHDRGIDVVAAFFYDQEGMHPVVETRFPFPVINLDGWRPGARLGGNFLRFLRGVLRLARLMTQGRFTLVETFTHHSNLLGLPIAWLLRVPGRIATHHGRPGMPRLFDALHGWLVNSGIASRMIAVSDQTFQEAIRREGVDPRRACVIRNGVAIVDAEPASMKDAAAVRRELDLPDQGRMILSVGRLVTEKGYPYLLEAIPTVLTRVPEAALAIAGDGPLRAPLEERASRLGIAGAVRFLGRRSDVRRLLQASDAYVQPSLREGLPLSLLEAMAAGIPVVATAAGGMKEVVRGEQNGLLVPPADPRSLAAALIRILEEKSLRSKLSRSARHHVRRYYSADRMCEEYMRVFQEAAGSRWKHVREEP